VGSPVYENLGSSERAEFSQRDVTMIVALSHAVPNRNIAAFLGISMRAVAKWTAANRSRIKPMADMLAAFMATNREDIRREAIEDWQEELKGLDRASLDSLILAIQSPDKRLSYEAGKEVRDRRLGTPKSSVHITGSVDHKMIHSIDPKVLQAFEQDVLLDAPLAQKRKQLSAGEVIDVEPIT
jgi:hypothetical protein